MNQIPTSTHSYSATNLNLCDSESYIDDEWKAYNDPCNSD